MGRVLEPPVVQAIRRGVVVAFGLRLADLGVDLFGDIRGQVAGVNRAPVVAYSAVVVLQRDGFDGFGGAHVSLRFVFRLALCVSHG